MVKNKTGDIEQTYQRKTQLEHILLRPDTYIGSVEYAHSTKWVYDREDDQIVQRQIKYVPGLYKIFDEILVNAADNKQRDPKMNCIRIDIDKKKNEISIFNNGKGIPVVMHKTEKLYVPEMIFGTLLTSSNYNDNQGRVTGGRNGFGAKLCNVFSTRFTVETSSKEYKKKFSQTWVDHMTKQDEPTIESTTDKDFTRVTFSPDLKYFKMKELEDDIIALMSRRAYDVAGTLHGVTVYLNDRKLPINGFKQYVELYTRNVKDEGGGPPNIVYEKAGARWEVAVTVSHNNFQQVSFVNSIATTKGGTHVDHVTEQVVAKVIETVRKKLGKKTTLNVKPFQIRNHMWIFVNCLIEDPTFDGQTKETMTLQARGFGSKCEVTDKFIKAVHKCGIIESIMSWTKFKLKEQADKKCSGKKTLKVKGLPKLEDANDAGSKNSHLCTLILTEGDSAKSLAIAGLGVIGRDRYGVFPLRGKMLNVREGTHKQVTENAEVNALLKIIGLQYKLKYDCEADMKKLRYGKVMIMADQDQDGSHIKGLVINFLHFNWPQLLQRAFVEEFITPIVKASKGKKSISFYSLPEYIEWRQNNDNWKTYRIKYYKGLGTSTAKEAKEYFSNMERHRIPFVYEGAQDDEAVVLAFSKKKIESRKAWLTNFMTIRKERRAEGQIEDYLYEKDTRQVSFADFVNKELILFSNADNERSIPSLVDGLKPGQRKVLFTCFKRADKKEVKVAQLAGAVGELSAYHHGEVSLQSTIVNMAHDFVGSNNINLLLPIGQFGTRLMGGKDAASARYIFTKLSPMAKALFNPDDENVLRFQYEENQRIEPEWYCPIIPTILVNGTEGIGTGWSTKIPNFNPRDIIDNIKRLINGEEMVKMNPWYRGFRGTIDRLTDSRFACSGEVAKVDKTTIEITELPIKTWTQDYKEKVMEKFIDSGAIVDIKEYHTDQTVKFLVKMTPEKLEKAENSAEGLHGLFKLQTSIVTTSMVLFDANGCLRRFDSAEQICQEFFHARKKVYIDRKAFLEGMLSAQSDRLSEQARFIQLKIDGQIIVEDKRKVAIVEQLVKHKFIPDPVKKWKEIQKRKELEMRGDAVPEMSHSDADEPKEHSGDDEEPATDTKTTLAQKISDYDYLVGLAIWKLSMEEKNKLMAESDAKKKELLILRGKTWSDLWGADIDNFTSALEKHEKAERAEIEETLKEAAKKLAKAGAGKPAAAKKKLAAGAADIKPNPNATRIVPGLDAIKKKFRVRDPVVKKPAPVKKAVIEDSDDSSGQETPVKKTRVTRRKAVTRKKAVIEDSDDSRQDTPVKKTRRS